MEDPTVVIDHDFVVKVILKTNLSIPSSPPYAIRGLLYAIPQIAHRVKSVAGLNRLSLERNQALLPNEKTKKGWTHKGKDNIRFGQKLFSIPQALHITYELQYNSLWNNIKDISLL